MAGVLLRVLPARGPDHTGSYPALMASVLDLVRTQPGLQRRTVCQALTFAAFSAYWTGNSYQLITVHDLNQTQIGLFALVGAVGVGAAPVAGRIAVRGDRFVSGVIADAGIVLTALSFALWAIGRFDTKGRRQRQPGSI